MGLIDDEHLVAVAHGREGSALAQLAGIVDTAVAGRIDLDHIQAAGAVTREVTAGIALAAGSLGRSLLTVQAPCEDPRGGGLPAAAGAREQVGVTDPPRAQRTPQGRGDVVLADHFGEGLGAVTAVQSDGHPHRLMEATDDPLRWGQHHGGEGHSVPSSGSAACSTSPGPTAGCSSAEAAAGCSSAVAPGCSTAGVRCPSAGVRGSSADASGSSDGLFGGSVGAGFSDGVAAQARPASSRSRPLRTRAKIRAKTNNTMTNGPALLSNQ